MARRLVRGSSRDGSGRIAMLCNPGATWSPRTTKDVIIDITSGQHTYLVWVSTFRLARLEVVPGWDGPYLRTTADGVEQNNLSRLPDCATVPLQQPIPIRRNVADLSDDERARFTAAIVQLARIFPVAAGDTDIVSWWFKQDQTHVAAGVHEGASFLPWHRRLCHHFEVQLREIDPDLALHYWDWTTDPRATPDSSGRPVNLMTPQFMGADSGRLGPPFDRGFYAPDTTLHRDITRALDPVVRAALPPPEVVRKIPPGKGPRQAAVADMDWSDQVNGKPPADATTVWLPDDRTLLGYGFGGDDLTAFARMDERMKVAHGWAHRYVGGDVARAGYHYAFRDPFVFLLHSNVDRLWASWQLRQQGDHRQWAWRLDGGQIYGSTATDLDLVRRMNPWSGDRLGIFPWTRVPDQRFPSDPDVVRPPLYDRYVYDDELCASWAALLLGKRLSSGVKIQATYEPDASDPGTVTIVLRLGPDVRWWKGVRVPAPGGDVMIEAEDDVREAQITVPVSALADGQLILHRREWTFWPFNTDKRIVHRLGDLGFLTAGSRLVLTWLA